MTPEELEQASKKVKAQALKVEGQELLKAVAAAQPKAGLVGPDGKALAPAAPVAPKGPSKEELLAIRAEMNEKVKALFKKDPMLSDLGNVMADLYRALIWVGQDIAAREGMTDALAAHVSQMCQAAVLSQPIEAEKLVSDLKKHTIPCLTRLKDIYARLKRRQRVKINRVNKDILAKGVTMPTGLAAAGLKALRLGESIILRGEASAVQAGVRQVVEAHERLDKGKACVLSTRPDKEVVEGRITMPAVWWKNCADNIETLDNILAQAQEAPATVLGVDDICLAAANRGQAAARLHSWCVNALAAGVFGEPNGAEVTFEGPFRRYVVTADVAGVLTYNQVKFDGGKSG